MLFFQILEYHDKRHLPSSEHCTPTYKSIPSWSPPHEPTLHQQTMLARLKTGKCSMCQGCSVCNPDIALSMSQQKRSCRGYRPNTSFHFTERDGNRLGIGNVALDTTLHFSMRSEEPKLPPYDIQPATCGRERHASVEKYTTIASLQASRNQRSLSANVCFSTYLPPNPAPRKCVCPTPRGAVDNAQDC